VTDAAGASDEALVGLEVVDTTPPALTLTAPLTALWPPDHRLVQVRPVLAATDACGAVEASITSATSSEPADAWGLTDGMTRPDIVMGDDGSVWLRAERDARGPGRIYTIHASAVDASGLTAGAGLDVLVPHDRRPAGSAQRRLLPR
jgi:hypothetical protein